VPACCGDGDGAFHRLLPAHLREVDVRLGGADEFSDVHRRVGANRQVAGHHADDLRERAHADGLDAVDDGGLGDVGGRRDDAAQAALAREHGHGDDAANGSDASVECEFAGEEVLARVKRGGGVGGFERVERGRPVARAGRGGRFGGRGPGRLARGAGRGNHAVAEQDGQRDGQVVDGPFLADVGRGEVDDVAPGGEAVAGVEHGGSDALDGLADRGVGQADDLRLVEALLAQVDLDLAGAGVDAGEHE